jgi:hypothetical protein
MTLKAYAVAMGLLGMLFVDPAAAQAPPVEEIVIGEGIAHLWNSSRPFKDVIQGDDRVVQITAGPTDRELIFVGKALGATNILVFDPQGVLLSNVRVYVGRAVNKTRIYGRGNLHEYWTYSCTKTSCGRIAGENETFERIPQGSTQIPRE